jgi:hypothetical protein
MFKTAETIRHALKRNKFTGLILYEGPSAIDAQPIVIIANRIEGRDSKNEKTGAMVQTWIMRADMGPLVAAKTGADVSICGQCPARPALGNFCYVNLGQAPRSTFEAYKRGRYARPGIDYDPQALPELFAGAFVRLGSYGDPGAAPIGFWQPLVKFARAVNGYSHQWQSRPDLQSLCMASVEIESQAETAQALGWRTFRVKLALEPKAKGEVICPASKEAGSKTTCADCKACGGLSAKAKASIVIDAHGPKANRYTLYRAV